MTTRTENLQDLLDEANAKLKLARKADQAGDVALRNSFLQQARDRFQAAEQVGMVAWCDRFLTK